MNIHPAFVHFPIALLVLYSVLELVPLAMWFPRVQWNPIKSFLLWAGFLGTIPTIATGLMAARLVGESDLVEAHEHAAFGVFGIYLFSILLTILSQKHKENKIYFWLIKLFALLGFVMLFVVGSLGAAMVYGYNVDPIVFYITKFLGLH